MFNRRLKVKTDDFDTKSFIRALVNGLSILELFKNDSDELGIIELSDLIGLPDSSVQRIVSTLEYKNYLYQNPENKKYRLSPKILQSCSKGTNFAKWREQSKRHMIVLNELSGESVNLAIRDANKCVYIELVPSKHVLRPNFTLYDYYFLYASALGKCLLSGLSDEAIMQFLPARIEALTPYTITDQDQLLKEIQEVRRMKYAIDNEELTIGMRCVGSPVFGIDENVIAALSVTAPTVRMSPEKMNALIPTVTEAAQKISEEFKRIFGYY